MIKKISNPIDEHQTKEIIESVFPDILVRVRPLPKSCYLELTPYCQNHCLGCFNVWQDDLTQAKQTYSIINSPLNGGQWLNLIDRLAGSSIKHCTITGGEPTIHPDFEKIIVGIDRLGLSSGVLTNGRWINPHHFVKLMKSLSHFFSMAISLHGVTAQSHERYTGIPGSFEETVANIRLATSMNLRVILSFVITPWNLTEIPQIFQLSKELGCYKVVFNRYLGIPMAELDVEEYSLKHAILEVEKIRWIGGNVDFGSCMPQCFSPNSSHVCGAATTFFTIDPWGNMRPCNHSPLSVGSLLSNSMKDLWYSPTLSNWRMCLPEECDQCAALRLCKGGCRALAEVRGSDPMRQQPLNLAAQMSQSLVFTYQTGGVPALMYKAIQDSRFVLLQGYRKSQRIAKTFVAFHRSGG